MTQNDPNNAPGTPSNNKTITLLPKDFRNELFDMNLAYLKVHQPTLFNAIVNHKCKEYSLCSNADGSPNILHIPAQQLVYNISTLEELIQPIKKSIDNLPCHAQVPESIVNQCTEKYKRNNPIQFKMLDSLHRIGVFSEMKQQSEMLSHLQGYNRNYIPLIRVYGIGLGYHLTELIKQKTISFMTIYEPHIDFFYTSLFTVPWSIIFKYFEGKGKGIHIALGVSPDECIKSNSIFINQNLTPLSSLFYRFIHFNNSPAIKEVIAKEPQSDSSSRNQSDAGWCEDQRIGFYLSARNIRNNAKFFSGQKTKNYFRAFIIGSGPSLNETIDYIKSHQNDAIIISCGTTIIPLIKAGIIPDYQVTQERTWHFQKNEEHPDLKEIDKVTLLKLNVVSPKVDKYYKDTLIFQKYRDPGSTLLGDNYAVTSAVNPTVTNAAISMVAELGVNEAYLFGVDYGAPIDGTKMHADNTVYDDRDAKDDVESTTCFDLPGNLGAAIRSTVILSWSHDTTEQRIALHPDIKWFNVGEGALIAGTIPTHAEKLPGRYSKKIKKQRLLNEIKQCFNNEYSSKEVFTQLRTEHTQQIIDYLQAMLDFTESSPQTRADITYVLTLLYKAMDIGKASTNYLPSSLLSYGFKQFINTVYIQNSMATDDATAASFFDKSKDILREYTSNIIDDFCNILEQIELDPEYEFYS